MQRERLQLALRELPPTNWRLFEAFASEFLSTYYPNLRSLASPSGDRGRDGELFAYDAPVETALQYSVMKDWPTKIRDTAKRLSETRPDTRILVYVTNQTIGPSADSLKVQILKDFNLVLDVHDSSWFLDRWRGDERREAACEKLAEQVVDPFLNSHGVLEHSAPTLSSTELQAAFTFLQLQWQDDVDEKGLTKLSFQALVRAALRSTNSESRMPRSDVQNRILALFPNHDCTRIVTLVDAALLKLNKRYVRHWPLQDEFCLAHEEATRVRARLAAIETANSSLDAAMRDTLESANPKGPAVPALLTLARTALNHWMLRRGETFAGAITADRLDELDGDDLRRSIAEVLDAHADSARRPNVRAAIAQTIFDCIVELLSEPSRDLKDHLRAKANAYTLLAFLGQTPDVQAAMKKLFSHGTIWLDTNVVLPLLAERLLPDEARGFTEMLAAAKGAGMDLRVTPGVIEEVERHVNACKHYIHLSHHDWKGDAPFLMVAYMRTGRSLNYFSSWAENFAGPHRPEDDIAEYLYEFYGVSRESLAQDERKADEKLRQTVTIAWEAVHAKRRGRQHSALDDGTIQRLVQHDVESYLGVLERRRQESSTDLGYSNWWLTLDRFAEKVTNAIQAELRSAAPATPVMSPDFLLHYLSIMPRRGASLAGGGVLPIALDLGLTDELPAELLTEAQRIRLESVDLPEHIVRRRVRDALDAAKRRPGRLSVEGLDAFLQTINRN